MYAQYYENGRYFPQPIPERMASRPAMSIEDLIRRKVASLRYWKNTKLYKRHSNWKFQFNVMTYNILSQNAVDNHRYLYRKCQTLYLMEDYRVSMVLPEILQSRSDIVCLQEVEEFVYEERMKNLFERNGFGSIFMKRTADKTDGCAILWRREKFQLVGQNGIEFRTKTNQLLDRDNIGLIAVLRPNHRQAGNILLHVATTHLLYNPKRGDVKLCQLRWLLAELERMALIHVKDNERHYHPVILCGDFNIQPHSPLYQFIETGRINVADTMSGDLSGQSKSKNSGRRMLFENLKLDNIGISQASRFEKIPPKRQIPAMPSGYRPTPTGSLGQTNPNSKPMDASKNAGLGQKYSNNISTGIASPENNTNRDKVVDNSSTINNPECSLESAECFSHDFKFVPAYKFHAIHQGPPPATSMTGNDCHVVDHIFYNVESKKDCHSYHEGTLKLLSVYTLLNAEDLKEMGGLPNAGFGSDHISLSAKFGIYLH